jgi:serine/threonine-protein kinase
MSLENPSMDRGPDGAAGSNDAVEVEVARVLEAYLAAVEAGQPADPRRLLESHPHLAGPLRACLRVLQVAERAAQEVTDAPGAPHGRPAAAPARGSATGIGSLSTLDFGPGEPPHVALHEPAAEPEPLLRPRSPEMPAPGGASLGRYQLQGEIARGGMGAILKGRDVDLGRELAIKVLLEAQRDNPEVVRRFVEEAQIGGQLQHPGVVPVYELGTFPDRRPYFAMKLVKGRTLAALLQERAEPGQALSRILSIFEQVCQTVAYAHARGVIHRDLKPSNVMVGSFGEVQVMDWGLAKVLPEGGIVDEAKGQPAHETVIMTVRSGSSGSGSESQAGAVLGTPAYMAPEQARGEVERVDERADVFGLGAILCEILTGRPPFVGMSREEIRAQATRGDLADALGRLEICGADAELIDLARRCLGPEQVGRPRHAGEVAGRMTAYLAGVQERLKVAELAQVEAQTRAEEAQARALIERSRRRRTVALAASVLVIAGLVGGGSAYLAQQRAERRAATERGVTEALAEVGVWRDQARKAAVTGNLDHWTTVLAAARHAQDLVTQGQADAALRDRVHAELIALEREQREAQAERRLLDELEAIRGNRSEHWDRKRTDTEYARAFRGLGIDLDQLAPEEAGKRIARQSAPVELASYLDDWAVQRYNTRGKKDEASWQRLIAAAQAADPDPWRRALRDLAGRGDLEGLRRLAADQRTTEAQPAPSLVLLGLALNHWGDRDRAEQVLRRARRLNPGDFWVNLHLGYVCAGPEEAARFLSASVALRPRSLAAHNNLGVALRDQGKLQEAIAEFRAALHLKPDYAGVHNNLGVALSDQGKLDEAITEFREALRHNSNDSMAHNNLGVALKNQGKLDEAITEFREALRHNLNNLQAHANLGTAHRSQGDFAEAIAELRKARNLAKRNPGLAQQIERDLAMTERQASLAARLPTVLTGKLKPGDATETVGFAELCYDRKHYGASARLWAEAFRAQPKLAEDLQARYRYNAACAAALAGCGQGKDNPPLDEAAKARWRKQAVDWLEANLAALSKLSEKGPSQVQQSIPKTLQHWKADPDLAALRDPAALTKLPADERKACRALWAEVAALLAKARGGTAP